MSDRFKSRIKGYVLRSYFIIGYFASGFIAASMPLIAGKTTYFYFSAFLTIILLLFYLSLEIYIRIKYPPWANFYTFYVAFSECLMGFLFYWISINAIICMTPYSRWLKLAHLIVASVSFWGLIVYFRYRYLPQKFLDREGFRFGLRNNIIDPENGLFNISSRWTLNVVSNKKKNRFSAIEKYSWVYIFSAVAGSVLVHVFEFERKRIGIHSFIGIAGTILSMFFAYATSLSMHDHGLIRQWEKKNGRLLKAK